jgi:hypothetical protein
LIEWGSLRDRRLIVDYWLGASHSIGGMLPGVRKRSGDKQDPTIRGRCYLGHGSVNAVAANMEP